MSVREPGGVLDRGGGAVTSRPGPELQELIGEAAFVRLAEAFGGTRLYVPAAMPRDHEIIQAVGAVAAEQLRQRLAPDYIKVPLARELRARHYRAAKMSNAQIARRLGVTESGVEKLFQRKRRERGETQPSLFD